MALSTWSSPRRPRQEIVRECHPELPQNNASARASLPRIFPKRSAKASAFLLSRDAFLVACPWERYTIPGNRPGVPPRGANNHASARASLSRIFLKRVPTAVFLAAGSGRPRQEIVREWPPQAPKIMRLQGRHYHEFSENAWQRSVCF